MVWTLRKPYRMIVSMVLVLALVLTLVPFSALADEESAAEVGDTVVALGEDLTQTQQNELLAEMNVDDDVDILYVANSEEHEYLGQYIDASIIGTRAISSTRITITEEGSGLVVNMNNITWVTEDMLANSLATAGVTDADVYVTAPFEVSGTAGLMGLVKAFEYASEIEIDEEQKQVANEEMVRTAELADEIGADEATELMRRLKEALDDRTLETDEDYRQLIIDIAAELNIELNEDDIESLIQLLKRLKGLNLDWGQIGDQLQNIRDNLDTILDAEGTRSFIRQAIDFLSDIVDRIRDLFSSN